MLIAPALVLAATSASSAQLIYYTSLVSFGSAATTNIVETFESAAALQVPLADFTHNGNTYTGFAGRNLSNQPFPNVYLAAAGADNFATPPILSTVLTANGDEDFAVDFGSPASAVGFDTYTNDFGPAVIKIYGMNGLLDTFSLAQDSTKVGFFGVVASEPISRIRWTTTDGFAVNTGIDNIRLGMVPEPATSSLMLAGLLVGAVLMLRRRQ
jgi:hypothetical protein